MLPGYDLERSTLFSVWAQNVLSLLSIFVCVHTCVHTHVHIHMEVRRQPRALPLRSHLSCSLDSVSHWPAAHLSGYAAWPANCKDASVSASPSPRLQIYITMPGFFMWVLGSLCSHSQHSTDWESPTIGFGLSYIRNLGETLFSTYSYKLGFGVYMDMLL